jgi:hypothetical protein
MRGSGIQLCSDEELFSTGEVWTFDEENLASAAAPAKPVTAPVKKKKPSARRG